MKNILAVSMVAVLLVGSFAFALDPFALTLKIGEPNPGLDVSPITIDGITYLPVRYVAEALGYKVSWISEERSVLLEKDSQSYKMTIGQNNYFVMKDGYVSSGTELSAAPFIKDNRTLIPAEYFAVFCNQKLSLEKDAITIEYQEQSLYTGVVQSVNEKELVIIPNKDADLSEGVVINLTAETLINGDGLKVGDYVVAYTSNMATRSLPPITRGFVIFEQSLQPYTIGCVIEFNDSGLGLLMGDVIIQYELAKEQSEQFYVGQWIQANVVGNQTLISPYLQKNFNAPSSEMMGVVYKLEGEITAVEQGSFDFVESKDSVGYVIKMKYDKSDLKVGQKVIVNCIKSYDNEDSYYAYSVLDKANKLTIEVEEIGRTDKGYMTIIGTDAKSGKFSLVFDNLTLIHANLSEVSVGVTLDVYTDGVVKESYPAQTKSLLVELN